jgi:hypothetical protein
MTGQSTTFDNNSSAPTGRWCRERSSLENHRPRLLPAEFRYVLVQADALEPLPQAAAERKGGAFLSPHGITENIAHFFLHAVAAKICLTL